MDKKLMLLKKLMHVQELYEVGVPTFNKLQLFRDKIIFNN